jgi:fatty-acyl-CoA synthase
MARNSATLRPFFWRATRLFPEKEVVARTHDGIERYTYGEFGERARALASGLEDLGVGQGDRVGTLAWNHHRHLEAYYAAPLMGAQLHTINPMLSDDHVEHIVDDAADVVLLVDPGNPLDIVERLHEEFDAVERVVVNAEEVPDTSLDATAYEDLLGSADYEWADVSPEQPAGMCYTSGTTGNPKGVEYTHEMIYMHAMMVMTPAGLDLGEADVVMPLVPMYHVNSWEFPYAAMMAGAKQVYPGPSPRPADVVDLIEAEGVTVTAGVPTVWLNVLEYLEDHDADLESLERIVVGGSAAPERMMRRYREEYDVVTEHAWGMTETMSIGSVSRPKSRMETGGDAAQAIREKQGLLVPGLEMKIVDDEGEELPWDGETPGELLVRGPTVIDEYYNRPEANEEDFEGDWLRTGDIATVDGDGYMEIVDREKDVIKSGGEWISSIELENALMSHDGVSEAAVISVDHETWQERPVACVVPRDGADLTDEELQAFLAEDYPSWWLPDAYVYVREIPKTSTGKFDKMALRDEYGTVELEYTPGE